MEKMRSRLNSALAKKRAQVQRTQWGMLDKVRVPKLKLPAITSPHERRRAMTTRETSGMSVQQEMSELSLRNAITYREHRHELLEHTERFSREQQLKPYIVRSDTARMSLTRREQEERMETVKAEMRKERLLLQQLNHSIRCQLRRVEVDKPLPDRSLLVKEIQSKIANIKSDVSLLEESNRTYLSHDLSPTKDFVRANKHELLTGRSSYKGGRLLRQNLERVEKMENALQRRAEDMLNKCESMEGVILRRQKRQIQFNYESAAERKRTAQREWLAILACLARLLEMKRGYLLKQEIRSRQVDIIAKCWRKFLARKRKRQLAALERLSRWGRQVISRWRQRKHGRRVKLIVSFLRDLERVSFIREHIRSYRRKVVLLQRQIRLYLQRARVSRRRLNVIFEKVERQVLSELMKEKVQHRRASEDVSAHVSKYKHVEQVDWAKMSPEVSKFHVDASLKLSVFTCILKSLRRNFSRERDKYLARMKEYRGIFRRSILFRARMQDFLDGTGNQDKFMNLDRFVDKNKGMKETLRSINKSMPTPPEFKETIPEEQMKQVVVLCLHLQSHKNLLLKILIKVAALPNREVMEALNLRRFADSISKVEVEEKVEEEGEGEGEEEEQQEKYIRVGMER